MMAYGIQRSRDMAGSLLPRYIEAMSAVAFDTLKLARKLEAAGFPAKQAADTAEALADAFGDDQVTKAHLDLKLRDLEQRMTIKLGGLMMLGIGAVATLIKLLPA